jgi:hypothetical protein
MAHELKNEVAAFLRETFDEVWPASTETEAAEPPDSWAMRIAEREKERNRATGIKAITKPELRADRSW